MHHFYNTKQSIIIIIIHHPQTMGDIQFGHAPDIIAQL